MPIVSTVVRADRDRGNGTRRVCYLHTDHVGVTREQVVTMRNAVTAEQGRADAAAGMAVAWKTEEQQRIFNAVLAGEDPAGLASDWLTPDEIAYQVARGAANMAGGDVVAVALYFQNWTDGDFQRVFLARWEAVKGRVANVLAIRVTLEADNALRLLP